MPFNRAHRDCWICLEREAKNSANDEVCKCEYATKLPPHIHKVDAIIYLSSKGPHKYTFHDDFECVLPARNLVVAFKNKDKNLYFEVVVGVTIESAKDVSWRIAPIKGFPLQEKISPALSEKSTKGHFAHTGSKGCLEGKFITLALIPEGTDLPTTDDIVAKVEIFVASDTFGGDKHLLGELLNRPKNAAALKAGFLPPGFMRIAGDVVSRGLPIA
jgi:hypothetical protein